MRRTRCACSSASSLSYVCAIMPATLAPRQPQSQSRQPSSSTHQPHDRPMSLLRLTSPVTAVCIILPTHLSHPSSTTRHPHRHVSDSHRSASSQPTTSLSTRSIPFSFQHPNPNNPPASPRALLSAFATTFLFPPAKFFRAAPPTSKVCRIPCLHTCKVVIARLARSLKLCARVCVFACGVRMYLNHPLQYPVASNVSGIVIEKRTVRVES